MIPELLNAAALALSIPFSDAAGCYEECETAELWFSFGPVNAAKIPTDGVLVLQGAYQGAWDDSVLSTIDVEVTLDGQPIAGALERSSAFGVLVWRPQDPWTPGTTYKLHTNATQEVPTMYYCAPAEMPWDGEIVVDVAPAGQLVASQVMATAAVQVQPLVTLATLACCEGSSPTLYDGSCGSYLNWDQEMCAPLVANGRLVVDFLAGPPVDGPASQQIVYTFARAGDAPSSQLFNEFTVIDTKPFCVDFEVMDLASGEVVASPQQCFGADVADQLGPKDLAIPDTLTCALQQCVPTSDGWDLDKCTPLDPEETPTSSDTMADASDTGGVDSDGGSGSDASSDSDSGGGQTGEKGCACATGAGGDAGALALLGAVGLARRRRRSRR